VPPEEYAFRSIRAEARKAIGLLRSGVDPQSAIGQRHDIWLLGVMTGLRLN